MSDADLAAVRETVSARTAGSTDESLARAWIAITRRRAPRRRPSRILVPVAAAAAVATLAVGTVAGLGGGDGGVDPAELLAFPRIDDPSEIRFPIDEYNFTTEGYANYLEATAVLAAECLARFEAEVSIADLNPGPLPDFHESTHTRLYGVFDREIAAEWGYGVPPDWGNVWPHGVGNTGRDLTDTERFLLVGRTDPANADRALPEDQHGDPLPEDGCQGEADRTLSGGLASPDWSVANNDSYAAASGDERVEAAEEAWSDCMRGRGYEYDSLREAADRAWPEPAGPEEIATALAEVDCKVETNLVGIRVGVETEFQQRFISDHLAELQVLKRWLETVYRNSEQVLTDADR
jgi:hypothetical protein